MTNPGARRRVSLHALAVPLLALLAAGAILLPSCEKIDRDMYDNPAFKAQEEPVRLPPADSVPTKGRARIPPLSEASRLTNPVEPTDFALLEGKELYGIFCTPCHGETGAGDGPVGKKYVPAPADIRPTAHGAHHADGELFVILTKGIGGMPAFRADLSPEERWKIIRFVRTLK